MQRLHEAEVMAEYGERAAPYVFSQVITKACEAIGVSTLSISEREITSDGIVLDFDGRPMDEKLEAACLQPVPEFDKLRRLVERTNFSVVLNRLLSGHSVAELEISGHPQVEDNLADLAGYNSEFRFVGIRHYSLERDRLILRNYNLLGSDREKLLQLHLEFGGSLDGHADELDILASPLPIETSLEAVLEAYGPETDFSEIEAARIWLENEARPYIEHFIEIAWGVGDELKEGLISREEAGCLLDDYERGLLTLLLVKFNPERAANLIDADDLAWAEILLGLEPDTTFLAAAGIARRNQLQFIACGGILEAILGLRQEWYGAYKKIGNCVNCGDGPKEVGEKGWCQGCISGHCGTR